MNKLCALPCPSHRLKRREFGYSNGCNLQRLNHFVQSLSIQYSIAPTYFMTCLPSCDSRLLFRGLPLLPFPSPFPPFSGLQQSCPLHCPSLSSLLHSLSFGLSQIEIHSIPSPLGTHCLPFPQGFHMVVNQCAVSTLEDGLSLRCVMILLHISKPVLNFCHCLHAALDNAEFVRQYWQS